MLKNIVNAILATMGERSLSRQFPFVRRDLRYHAPVGPRRHLPPEFFEPVARVAGDGRMPQPEGELHGIWRTIPGAHKWHHYFPVYDSLFSALRTRPIRMLEIGVFKGGSATMWRRYLHPDSVFVGIDIDPSCAAYADEANGLHIRIGDQSSSAFLASIVSEFGPFDVIIDDGSHVCSHMIASFSWLFLNGLTRPGLYIAEDTHSNYWDRYRDTTYSFMDLAKDLVDVMHEHYIQHQDESAYRAGGRVQVSSITVSRIASELEEIQFRDSMVVIRRAGPTTLPASEMLS